LGHLAGRGVKGVERIFAFARKVTIKQRKFLYWGQALAEIKTRWKNRLLGRPVASVAGASS
jgi:hypothetical protein